MICAALLEPLVANGWLAQADVERSFGTDIAWLVSETRTLQARRTAQSQRGTRLARELSSLFVAAYQDPRLAILAAADGWRRCGPSDQPSATVDRVSLTEAQQVLVPLLGMLGMWDRRKALEIWLASQPQDGDSPKPLWTVPEQTELVFQSVLSEIEQTLSRIMPDARLSRRQQPATRGDLRPGTIDRLSLDLLVDNEADCYRALHLVHRQWRPVEGAIQDYIGASKINGYRCLRTTIVVPDGPGLVRVELPHPDERDGGDQQLGCGGGLHEGATST